MDKQAAKTVVLAALLVWATVVAYVPAIRAGSISDDKSDLTEKQTLRTVAGQPELRPGPAAPGWPDQTRTALAQTVRRCHRCLNWLV